MIMRMLIQALVKFRNIGFLLAWSFGGLLLKATNFELMPPLSNYLIGLTFLKFFSTVGLIIFMVMVAVTFFQKEFIAEFNKSEKCRELYSIDRECIRVSQEAKAYISAQASEKLRRVLADKYEVLKNFEKGERGFVKDKLTKQYLELVLSYVSLLSSHAKRKRELAKLNINEIANRLNNNQRRLSFEKNFEIAESIKKMIEMDETIIERVKTERIDLEKIGSKIDYIESTLAMIRQQILSSFGLDETSEKLEEILNEVTALDTVLDQRRKSKIRI